MTYDSEFHQAVIEFVSAFEKVFGTDWSYTKSMLGITHNPERDAEAAEAVLGLFDAVSSDPDPEVRHSVSPDATFIEPDVNDEGEDWGNRAILLDAYRRLKSLLAARET